MSSGVEEIILHNGRKLIMYQDYTFSYRGSKGRGFSYLYCSKKDRDKCSARLKISIDGEILASSTGHNHPPPKYTRCSDGTYVKIH